MTRCTQVITHNKHISTPPTLAGLFFCLASAEGAGLLFCPAAIQPHTSVYNGFYIIYAVIPPTPQNNAHGFTGAFPAICLVLPPLCGGCIRLYRTTRAAAPPAHTRTTATPGRCTAQHSRPIIIKYIRRAACYGSMPDSATYCRPCQPGGVSSCRL